jgi:hypothetical protein
MATKSNADYGEEQRREYAVEDLCEQGLAYNG